MGLIAYTGPSRINGKPVVLLVSGENGESANEKTGPMAQTWILPADVAPHVAIHTGDDESVCGGCPLRGLIRKNDDGTTTNYGRSCYVSVRNAPRAVWNAWKSGKYKQLADSAWSGLKTRLGAYGDPAAVPFKVLADLVKRGSGKWTGYTHQWRKRKFQQLRMLVMASTSSVEETREAWRKGWRTFRIRKPGEPLLKGEFECPASQEAGKRKTCDTCGACNGIGLNGSRSRLRSVSIVVHGTKGALRNYARTMHLQGEENPTRFLKMSSDDAVLGVTENPDGSSISRIILLEVASIDGHETTTQSHGKTNSKRFLRTPSGDSVLVITENPDGSTTSRTIPIETVPMGKHERTFDV